MKHLVFVLTLSAVFMSAGLAGAAEPALKSPLGANKSAAAHNDGGVTHYNKGHWDVAAGHFMEAVEIDPKFAEAHFNLALAYHNANNHAGATKHFSKAKKLGKNNKAITESKTLKGHIK